MHLQEVQALDAQAFIGVLHLPLPFGAPARPHLGGDEKALARAQLGDEIARHRFRRAVHRRRVDEASPRLRKDLQHFAKRRPCRLVVAGIEGLPGAKADHGELLAGRRNRASDEILGMRPLRERSYGKGGDDGAASRVHDFILVPRYTASAAQMAETAAAMKARPPSPAKNQPETASPPR